MNDSEQMSQAETFFQNFLAGMVESGMYESVRSGRGRTDLGSPDFIASTRSDELICFNIRFRPGNRPQSDLTTDNLLARYPKMRILYVEDIEAGRIAARTDRGAQLISLVKNSDVLVSSRKGIRFGNLAAETAALARVAESIVVNVVSELITKILTGR